MKRQAYQWLLKVENGRNHDLLLHKLGLKPSKYDATQYISFYAPNAKPQLMRHIGMLKAAGLHGLAKKVADKRRKPVKSKAKPRRSAPKPAPPSAEIVALNAAKRRRLEREKDQRSRELKRQAEIRADRDAAERARRASLQAKGEL